MCRKPSFNNYAENLMSFFGRSEAYLGLSETIKLKRFATRQNMTVGTTLSLLHVCGSPEWRELSLDKEKSPDLIQA